MEAKRANQRCPDGLLAAAAASRLSQPLEASAADGCQLPLAKPRTHVFMFEEAKHLQLPEHPLARNKVLEDVGHLFEGDSLPVSGVRHRPTESGKRQLAVLA